MTRTILGTGVAVLFFSCAPPVVPSPPVSDAAPAPIADAGPSPLPADILAELACVAHQVESGIIDPVAIGVACSIAEVQIVYDLLDVLLGSKQWVAAHPAIAPTLKAKMKASGR